MLYSLARQCFNEKVARTAGITASICGTFIFFEGEILAVALEVFLNLLLLRQLIIATNKQTPSYWITAGLFAGLAALTRPNILLFIALFIVWFVLHCEHEKGKLRRRCVLSSFSDNPFANYPTSNPA